MNFVGGVLWCMCMVTHVTQFSQSPTWDTVKSIADLVALVVLDDPSM
jgi:hypothetical protein